MSTSFGKIGKDLAHAESVPQPELNSVEAILKELRVGDINTREYSETLQKLVSIYLSYQDPSALTVDIIFKDTADIVSKLYKDDPHNSETVGLEISSIILKELNISCERVMEYILRKISSPDTDLMSWARGIATYLAKIPAYSAAISNENVYTPILFKKMENQIIAYYKTIMNQKYDEKFIITLKQIKDTPIIHDQLIDKDLLKRFKFYKKYKNDNTEMSKEQKDILTCVRVLTHKEKVLKQLQKLDDMLKSRKKSRLDTANSTYNTFKENDVKSYKDQKIISGFFDVWLEQNGFGKIYKLTDFLTSRQFLKKLAQGRLFKDPGARGFNHNEWTHLIQWFVLVETNKEEKIFNVEPHKILQWIGSLENMDEAKAIWNETLESLKPSGDAWTYPLELDGSNVQELNKFILSEECKAKFPTLHELILARTLKHEESFNIYCENHPQLTK